MIYKFYFFALMYLPLFSIGQTNFKGKWEITNAKNTLLELGAVFPAIKDFSSIKKKYVGKYIYFNRAYFLFSKKLKPTSSYCDTVFIRKKYNYQKKDDTELTLKYPGDELNCDSLGIANENCFVGASFMKLLGLHSKNLTLFDATGNLPDQFKYKVCIINKNTIGLLCENANVLLILKAIP